MKRYIILLASMALAVGVLAVPSGAAETPQNGDLFVPESVVSSINAEKAEAVYIVQLVDMPVIAYEGDIKGYAATKPRPGKKINPNSAKVTKYVDYLNGTHRKILEEAGVRLDRTVYDYVYSFNGFAARMTGRQAAALASSSDVSLVMPDYRKYPTTDNSPSFLGVSEPDGSWDVGYNGEDVVVGVIDTGIWPEHPSFSDRTDTNPNGKPGKLGYHQIPGWHGKCVPGEAFNASMCNQKLIGAQYFYEGFGLENIIGSGDYLSARDADGHGTHTSSTAAGNADVPASILGSDLGTISGIAPRARVAMYKACWADAGCAGSDLTMAIDQAVADGVDVINYSIGSSATTLASDDIAFLFAADAGVFVATSAGNAGPGASTIGSPAWVPWTTAVGASTQDRTFTSTVTLGNAAIYTGEGIGEIGPNMLVDAEDAGDELCNIGALDPAVAAGNIVLCKRGDIPLIHKSQAVLEAGGVGMVLYNQAPGMVTYLTSHAVAAAHISNADGLAIKAYIDTAGIDATASIDGGNTEPQEAPWMVGFSSRGPNGGSMDLIKPDVTAPGFGILAGYSPTPFSGAPGELFAVIQGTSMASPHVAGAFALLKQAHPDWTPAIARSALMTTAYQDVLKEDGVTAADPFDMGAGHLNPNPALDPGLAYDAGFSEYLGFLCEVDPGVFLDPAGTCASLDSIGVPTDAKNLNYPSIGVASLAGVETITRTVTNVGTSGTYEVTVDPPPGVDVTVSPSTITLASGDTAIYDVTFTVNGAPFDQWTFGSLTWSDGTRLVRSPIAVKPAKLAAPAEVVGTGTSGSLSFDVRFGYAGSYTAGTRGLVAADMQPEIVVDDPANDINVALATGVGITVHTFDVPGGSSFARFSLFDDYTDGVDDLDLYVFDPSFAIVGSSGSGTSAEQVDLHSPIAGTYYVVVHGWQTDGPDSSYTLFNWAFGPNEHNVTVTAPASATLGSIGTITVDWADFDAGTKYLGAVSHSDGVVFDQTIIRIDTD